MAPMKTVSDADIQVLKDLLQDTNAHVFGPSDEGYDATIKRWSRAAEKPAGVSILPTTSEEVSIAVKYATEQNLDVAVKGGGHSTAGASSTNGGLLINLSRMRKVNVDPEKKLLHVQGGALWSDVDSAAWRHGLATVGGTVSDTGVGGLTLGGGYGHLTGSHGLVIDNTLAATVVLADGSIMQTSPESHPDLFWALLGAGQNFGITTSFTFRAFPQSDLFTGFMLFPPTPSNIEKLVEACNDLYTVQSTGKTQIAGKGMTLLAIAKPPPAGGQTMLLCILSYDGPQSEGDKMFKAFYDLNPVVNTMAMRPYPDVNNLLPTIQGARSSMKGASFLLPLREEFVAELIQEFEEFVDKNPDAAASLVAFEVYDAKRVGELENGCFANRGYHLNGLVMPTWFDEKNDSICRQWARDISNIFKKEMEGFHGEETGQGAGRRGHKGAVMLYGNYDQYDEISKDIFGENYPLLQALKKKYDPGNCFDKLFAIMPA